MREPTPSDDGFATLLVCIAATTLLAGLLTFIDRGFILAFCGMLATGPLLAAQVRFHRGSITGLTMVLASVTVGTLIRPLVGYFGIWSERFEPLFLAGRNTVELGRSGFIVAIGFVLLASGYAVGWRSPGAQRRPLESRFFDQTRTPIACLVLLAAGMASTFLFIQSTGGIDLGSLSAKRTTLGAEFVESGRVSSSLGVLRLGASLSFIAALIAFRSALVRGWSIGQGLLVLVSIASAFVLPIYSSSRAELLVTILGLLFVLQATRGELRIGRALPVFLVALVAFQFVTVSRTGSEDGVAASIIMNRNLADLHKQALIIDSVPGTLDLRYGETIATYLVAPIPRQIWPGKPIVSPGLEIGQTVFGSRVSGVPPGMVGELYWNFDLFGVIFGSFAIGIVLARLDKRFLRRGIARSDGSVVLFASAIIGFGNAAVGGAIGQAFFDTVVTTVIVYAAVSFAAPRQT